MTFNRAHLNKYLTFFLEAFVLIYGVAVAIFQGQVFWQMFAFGMVMMTGINVYVFITIYNHPIVAALKQNKPVPVLD